MATSHGHHLTGFPTPVSHCQLAASSTCPLWSDLTHFHTSSLELSLTFFPTFDNLLQVTFFVTSRQPLHSARSSARALGLCLTLDLTATHFLGLSKRFGSILAHNSGKANVAAFLARLFLVFGALVQTSVVHVVSLVVVHRHSSRARHLIQHALGQL